ncbi:MAG: hypothetical protein JO047_14260 [Alphaproteobacteria bacterium]|nr:hypothetical protein [Alphaproteobacteria bacterium]
MTNSQTATAARVRNSVGLAFAATLLAGALASAPAMAAHDRDHGGHPGPAVGGGHPAHFGGFGSQAFRGHLGGFGEHVRVAHFSGHEFFGSHRFVGARIGVHPFGVAGWHGRYIHGHYFGPHFGFVAGRWGTRVAIGIGGWHPGYRYGYWRPGYRYAYAPYGFGVGYPYWHHHHYAPRYACRVIGWR